jgi:phthiodiolone/phenolphthiodiolone dimycocerosates ketoreductase
LSVPPFQQCVDWSVLSEQQGFDFVFYGDQLNGVHPTSLHTPEFTAIANILPDLDDWFEAALTIAVAARQASEVEFVYGLIDAVRRPPPNLAQMMFTLDHATKGRTITVVATGENKQMKPYGISRKGASDKLWDMVHILKQYTGRPEPVSYEGRAYRLDKALMDYPPYGDTPPRLWVAGGSDEALYLAGTLADGWLTYPPAAVDDDPEVYRAKVDEIRRHAKAAGRDPDEISLCVLACFILHEDEKVVDELRDNPIVKWTAMLTNANTNCWTKWGLTHPMGDNWAYSQKLFPYLYSKEEALDICERTPREAVDRAFFTGTSEQVLDRLAPYFEIGMSHMFLLNWAPIAGVEDTSPELFKAIKARW